MFNVGRATHWAIADGLGVNPKADPFFCNQIIAIKEEKKKCMYIFIQNSGNFLECSLEKYVFEFRGEEVSQANLTIFICEYFTIKEGKCHETIFPM